MKLKRLTPIAMTITLALMTSACSTTPNNVNTNTTAQTDWPLTNTQTQRPTITDPEQQYEYAKKLLDQETYKENVLGQTPDLTETFYWYHQAATNGHLPSQFMVANFYMDGANTVTKDPRQALYWFTTSANNNFPMSQTILGKAYAGVEGLDNKLYVGVDVNKALYWLNKGAEHYDREAEYQLGNLYHKGTLVTKNDKQALFWHKKSAYNNHAAAQGILGSHFQYGVGEKQNYTMAYAWYLVAIANNNSTNNDTLRNYIIEIRDKLSYTMTAQQLDAAQKIAEKVNTAINK